MRLTATDMDFTGTGKRLSQGDIGDAARALGVETAVLLAFMEVEAAGKGFDSRSRPKMLFEPHIFWRELGAGALRDRAVALGLAYAKWRAGNYPSDSYPRLTSAIGIAKDPGLRSASYGLGQIMGFNCRAAGHATAEQLVRTAMQGEREQLMQLVTLLRDWGLDKLLRGRDFSNASSWADIARRYNGSGYATHNYHGRMAAAYVKHATGAAHVLPSGGVLARGMKGEAVRALQADLAALGYEFLLGVDGRFGDETEAHVRAFQHDAGIAVDGKVGPQTAQAIAEALHVQEEDQSPPPPEWPGQKPAAPVGLIAAVVAALGALATFLSGLPCSWFGLFCGG